MDACNRFRRGVRRLWMMRPPSSPKHSVCYDNLRLHWMRLNWFSFHSSALMFQSRVSIRLSHRSNGLCNPCVFSIFTWDVVCANATSTWLNNWSAVEHCLILKMMPGQTREKCTDITPQQISLESFESMRMILLSAVNCVMLIMEDDVVVESTIRHVPCNLHYIGAKWLFFGQFAHCHALDSSKDSSKMVAIFSIGHGI